MRDPVDHILGGQYGMHFSTVVWNAGIPDNFGAVVEEGIWQYSVHLQNVLAGRRALQF